MIFEENIKLLLNAIRNQNSSEKDILKSMNISSVELKNLIKYCQDEKYVETVPFSEHFFDVSSTLSDWRISSKGLKFLENIVEVKETKNSIIHVKGNVNNFSNIQGNNNTTTQTIDNSQYNILKQLIENDSELDQPKKTKLLDLLDKFNKLKETGENASDLIKTVGGIAIKYAPLFFSLIQ